MAILYLNGKRFKRIIDASVRWLNHNMQELNNINVFPVPDGDTGTNMVITLKNIHFSLINSEHIDDHLPNIANRVSKAAIIGARGNSGVILSQVFKGFSDAIGKKHRLNAMDIALSLKNAYEKAYNSIINPVEGTIITVLRESINAVNEKAKNERDIIILIETLLAQAKKSLENTKNMLPELKKAGVIDAGGKGFVYIVEGIYRLLKGEKLPDIDYSDTNTSKVYDTMNSDQKQFYGYCLEFIINGKNLDRTEIKSNFLSYGDSLLVAGEDDLVRIHIHTKKPGKVIEEGLKYGILDNIKIDNMDLQHSQQKQENLDYQNFDIQRIKIVTDSTSDLPKEVIDKYDISVVPLSIHFGEKHFKDNVDLTSKQFYKMLRTETHHPKTSQPSPDSFMKTYSELLKKGHIIISIHISSKMSGTMQSASLAKQELDNENIHIIDSGSVSLGLGLIVSEAAKAAQSGKSLKYILFLVEKIKKGLELYFTVNTLEYLEKGGRIGKASAMFGSLLNIKPILTVKDGMVHPYKKVIGKKNLIQSLVNIMRLKNVNTNDHIIRFAHADYEHGIKDFIKKTVKEQSYDKENLSEVGAVVGTHAGPGCLAVCFSRKKEIIKNFKYEEKETAQI